MKTSVKLFFYLAIVFVFAGCSGHPRHGISVAITGAPSTVAPNQVVNLAASVSGDTANAGVTWAVNGAGTFTSTTTTLTYTAPPTVPATPTVSVTATSITDPTKSNTVTFTIAVAAVGVTITNPVSTVTAGSTANIVFNATVANDPSNAGVTWQLVTAGGTTPCSPACGTMVASTISTFTYLPPATVPASASVSLIATAVADTTKSDTDTFTIQAQAASALSFLSGPYAFAMSGFDGDGNALTVAGSITADGNGGITSGEIDINDRSAVSHTTTITGTYTLDTNLRGIITLNQPLNGFSDTPGFSFTLDSNSNTGNIIGADEELPAVAGPLVSQSAAVLSGTPSGNFIFRASSDAQGARFGEVGRFSIGSGGSITAGLVDSADIVNGNDSQDATLVGSFGVADGTGRGEAILDAGSESSNFAYYAVSPTKLFLIQTDPQANTQLVGVARGQSSLTAGSVNGTGAFGVIGGDFDAQDQVQFGSVLVGQAVISGGNTASISCDLNDAGSVGQCSSSSTGIAPVSGTVAFDPTTGRGTITLPGGFDDGFVDSVVFYLEANGAGVLLDTTGINDASSSDSFPEALVGDLIPQTSTKNIFGQVQGVGLTSETDVPAIVGQFAIDELGDISGLFDGTSAGTVSVTDSITTGVLDSGTDSTGRSTVTISGGAFGDNLPAVEYQANPTEFFVIGQEANSSSNLGVFTSQTLPETSDAIKRKNTASGSGKKLAPKTHKVPPHASRRNVHHSNIGAR